MERRDIIKDEIERLGKAIGSIIAKFLGTNSNSSAEEGIISSIDRFKSELGIDIHQLIDLPSNSLLDYFNDQDYKAEHIELLANYLSEIGKRYLDTNKLKAQNSLCRSLELYELTDQITQSVSFERMDKVNEINHILQQIK